DVPLAGIDRLARLSLRLRLQPDARPAARRRRPAANAPEGRARARPRGQPDRRARPLLRLHGRPGIELRRRARVIETRPGRTCPLSYRYSPRVFDRDPDFAAGILYVVGGLYGNVMALEALWALAARDAGPVSVVFNGDFHWFDVAPADFERVS